MNANLKEIKKDIKRHEIAIKRLSIDNPIHGLFKNHLRKLYRDLDYQKHKHLWDKEETS